MLLRGKVHSERRKELDMNSVRKMKRRRSSLGSIALSLLVIGGLVLGVAPTQAATVDSTLTISVSGSFTAADGKKYTVSGSVLISSSAVMDDPDVPPFVMLTFDSSNVKLTSGAGASRKTYDSRGYQVTRTRPLKATDVIQMPIPTILTDAPLTSADRYEATFTLNFNTAGQLTSGTVRAAPVVTAAQ
jgi:hypothetical protein